MKKKEKSAVGKYRTPKISYRKWNKYVREKK